MKKVAAILLLILLIACFAACTPASKTARGFSMGSEYYVTYTSNEDLDLMISEKLSLIEEGFSVRSASSVLFRINGAEKGIAVPLTEEENEVLFRCFSVSSLSEGAFDPAILPLVKVWGFDPPYQMNGSVPPSAESITLAKSISDLSLFNYSYENKVIAKSASGACLDLGGAVKGYAAECIRDLIKGKSKEALVYIGGTIAAVGRDYTIGVTPPRDSEESYAFRFLLKEGEICATSGDYERYYLFEGERYHHILDKRTGAPANSGVISATIVCEDGIMADALATAAIVLGAEKGLDLIKKCGAKGALVTSDKKVIAEGLSVTIKDNNYEIA